METVVPLGGAAVDDIRQPCSDAEVSDDGSSEGGGGLGPLRTGPLCVVRGRMTSIGFCTWSCSGHLGVRACHGGVFV